MSYYYFNRKNLLQKAKDKYHNFGGKEKVLKENAKNKNRNLSEEEKETKKEYGKDRNRNIKK